MMEHEPKSLGTKLSPILGGGFFRPLTRRTAPIYVDCADRLAEAADEGGQIPCEARLLIREVLTPSGHSARRRRGRTVPRPEPARRPVLQQTNRGALAEPRRISLDEHYVLITPPLRRLLRLLRELAEDRPAELKDFAATLRALCQNC